MTCLVTSLNSFVPSSQSNPSKLTVWMTSTCPSPPTGDGHTDINYPRLVDGHDD